ncbi:non-structural maintenance of chromosomes element 3 homolog [Acanthaster planci]|uniref:Non-structural maintenance of chromosomes element 3 homolog n=1 Tax=Acanthaster planci TaxID=133434 RepID=A0A8B7ZH31_ACAPL|nr:non-structural maintenance of chromosomes element 3 homolog [Acanthaster planci]XP_022104894.1 non-structural maintenance of chromosomes element 3 homolog [Acanthaster planci]XP_022104895.1 non-structural maintenance of chromosomes element 3 homolog [Acanthaster planci]XP_022104896.1 non-structural maintenance of chromosomes element 3 homolog [Acanthaster planci]
MPRVPASSQRQSQGRRRRPREVVDAGGSSNSDDGDFEVNGTQATSQSQTQSLMQADKAAAKLTPELIERKVGELVQYLLIMEQRKIPVRRGDITKNVLKEYRNILPHVLERAKRKLKLAFGFEVIELLHKTGRSTTKMYILLNKIDAEKQGHFIDSSRDDPKVGLLITVLSIIFMSGGTVTEPVLWHTLKKLGIRQDEKNHEVFGDVKKLLTSEFASKQMYLDYTRIPNTDPPAYQFKWGLRAQTECTKRRVLEFVCKMYGNDMDMKTWKEQYREVLQSENADHGDDDSVSSNGDMQSDDSEESD